MAEIGATSTVTRILLPAFPQPTKHAHPSFKLHKSVYAIRAMHTSIPVHTTSIHATRNGVQRPNASKYRMYQARVQLIRTSWADKARICPCRRLEGGHRCPFHQRLQHYDYKCAFGCQQEQDPASIVHGCAHPQCSHGAHQRARAKLCNAGIQQAQGSAQPAAGHGMGRTSGQSKHTKKPINNLAKRGLLDTAAKSCDGCAVECSDP